MILTAPCSGFLPFAGIGLDEEFEVERARIAGGLERVHILGGGRHSDLGLSLVCSNCLLA